jgi:hypothetical protein
LNIIPQHRLGFQDALGRQLHMVRVSTHGTIEVIGWDGVKGACRGGQPPEASTGRLAAGKLLNSRGFRIQEYDGHRPAAHRQPGRELFFELLPIGHVRSS